MPSPPGSEMTELRRGVVESCVLAPLEVECRYGCDLVRTMSAMGGLATSQGTVSRC
ncbi:MAG TPA: hypothetical protein VMV23_11075 [Candidatus Nanopelagicaceae bacterium]|nr:hypothetical protein [Candidatus Nanopelagicaceae bacterium]